MRQIDRTAHHERIALVTELIVVFTSGQQASLKRTRPAWIEHERAGGFTYYREDHNTAWFDVDQDGYFVGMSDLIANLAPVRGEGAVTVALLRIKDKESIDAALSRAQSLPIDKQSSTLRIDSAILVPSDASGRTSN
jgi:hypothetical protein